MGAVMKDPKGNELKVVLLQVMDKDEQGPLTLRVRYDHERIDLTNERDRTFLVMWTPVDSVLGEMRINDVYDELQEVKAQQIAMKSGLVDQDRAIEATRRDLAAMEAENKTKTEALRVLQKERDPDRLEAMVAARTVILNDKLTTAHAENADLKRWIEELRAAKKRLKEANERLKENK